MCSEFQIWLFHFKFRVLSTVSCYLSRFRWLLPIYLIIFKFKVKRHSFLKYFLKGTKNARVMEVKFRQFPEKKNYGVSYWPLPIISMTSKSSPLKLDFLPLAYFVILRGRSTHPFSAVAGVSSQRSLLVNGAVSSLLLMFVWFFLLFQPLPYLPYPNISLT